MSLSDPHDQINASSDIEELRRLAHAWLDDAARHARNEEFYRNIVDQTGLTLGRECCRQDDGNYTDEPLALRVPEVAQKLVDDAAASLTAAEALWQLLDDIDTLDDACRDNDSAFRTNTRKCFRRRFNLADSDGYALYWKHLNQTPPPSPPASSVPL